ncbi:PREDICTED: F-box/LRR-repeat protein At3g58980-like [Camelina sativa]|uniref:F-box/LRR-repeat protein At3g58980-like n=1 Tax=Camelina sativa TaxID=90675 RepID=A0ABM0Y477_CAMSA|nr:PREDICTED: F-box/LRR-repeat protein At3g58980-like [Camelina sativa]
MDRISDLPDGIIIRILSFLSIDEAASTSVLSTRWRDMFAFTPHLHLSLTKPRKFLPFVDHRRYFMDFVDRVLAVSGNSAIKSFTLKCRLGVGSAHTNRWICNVLNRGVLDLHLDAKAQEPLIFEVFACKTLVKLKLNRFEIPMLPEDASLPALKIISLHFVTFYNLDAFEKLISACPLLEELIMIYIAWELWKCSHIFSCPTLKRLTIGCIGFSVELGSMSFDNPNLVYLEYSDFVQLQYPVVNLDSLVEAKIGLTMKEGGPDNCDPSNLIRGLRNVEILNLSCPETVEIFGIFHEAMPMFANLLHLTITSEVDFCSSVSSLPSLLKKAPNLHTLVIKGILRHDNPVSECECFLGCSRLSSCPVKVLEITEYEGSIKELDRMKRFLEELSCLELVKVCASAKDDKEKLRLSTDLLMLCRASSQCEIKVEFS